MRRAIAVAIAAVAALAIVAAAEGGFGFSGSITAADPTQTGALNQNNTASSCATAKSNPGAGSAGTPHYDALTDTNSAGSQQCYTVTLTLTAGTGQLFVAAYLGSYDPAHPATNYLADPGTSASSTGSTAVSFSFKLDAGQTYVVVVQESGAGGCLNCTYNVQSSSANVAARFRSASASSSRRGVVLRWRTAYEQSLLGFSVFRLHAGRYVRLNHALVAARGLAAGAAYRYLDRTAPQRGLVRYRIQTVDLGGSRSWLTALVVRR